MKRTTITISEQSLARLEREARRRHTSVSAVVRECVEAKFPPEASSEGERHIPFANIGASVAGPYAADMDDFLSDHWAEDILRHRG
ncbi:MAG: ribbon-helix-helix protein, CopG family [Dehalococcoidia bacterium]